MDELVAHFVELRGRMELSPSPRPFGASNRRGIVVWSLHILLILLLVDLSTASGDEQHQRISGSAGDVLEDDPVGRLKVFVYDLPAKYNTKVLQKDSRCLHHMFATEIFLHRFLLSSPVRTLNPDEADWFFTPVYTTCDLTPNGLPLPFKSPRMMRSAIAHISTTMPYWNRTEGADHFFVVPHDFGACFHYQVYNSNDAINYTVSSKISGNRTFYCGTGEVYFPDRSYQLLLIVIDGLVFSQIESDRGEKVSYF